MNDFNKNLRTFYFILGITAVVLILTGIFLGTLFQILGINPSKKILLIFQIAFIISGIGDIYLLFYAKNKLG